MGGQLKTTLYIKGRFKGVSVCVWQLFLSEGKTALFGPHMNLWLRHPGWTPIDICSMVAEIGGYSGLLLGFSLMDTVALFSHITKWMFSPPEEIDECDSLWHIISSVWYILYLYIYISTYPYLLYILYDIHLIKTIHSSLKYLCWGRTARRFPPSFYLTEG